MGFGLGQRRHMCAACPLQAKSNQNRIPKNELIFFYISYKKHTANVTRLSKKMSNDLANVFSVHMRVSSESVLCIRSPRAISVPNVENISRLKVPQKIENKRVHRHSISLTCHKISNISSAWEINITDSNVVALTCTIHIVPIWITYNSYHDLSFLFLRLRVQFLIEISWHDRSKLCVLNYLQDFQYLLA